MKCRHCESDLHTSFLDLGTAPPSNAYLSEDDLKVPETWYPLRLLVCQSCLLVQTEDHAGRESLFTKDYAYFSSFSTTWLDHAKAYVREMIERFKLNKSSCVVEVASNDGYLLQYVKAEGISCYGVEPTASTASAARKKGIDVVEKFFGADLGRKLTLEDRQADLMVANNVLAHVPDINDFVKGFAALLKPAGVATFEFPHLLQMVHGGQFDTAYHEHYSYLSLHTVEAIFLTNGLSVFDVEQLPTHGGSLRVFAQRIDSGDHQETNRLMEIRAAEVGAGVASLNFYHGFQKQAEQIRDELLLFLIDVKRQGKSVAAYGAAAKGNTLLNFAGVKPDLLPYVVDKNPAKLGRWMPGSRIPIVDEEFFRNLRPNYVLILPWNLRPEVVSQLQYIREWGGEFVTVVPRLVCSSS